MKIEHPDGTQVRVTRAFDAPVARVWRAFTEPVELAAWFWGGHTRDAIAEVDLRVGGRYSVYTDGGGTAAGWPRDRVGVLGIYADIVPESRLVYTVHWDAPVGYNQRGGLVLDEVVIVSMQEAAGATTVVMLHTGIPDDGVSAVEHGKGIGDEFDWLARLVEPG
jgi:uncharacterized protein YndB with AHSA1/START domain